MQTKTEQERTKVAASASSDDLDETWQQRALKSYFMDRPGLHADTLQLMGHFKIASILEAAEDLIKKGWLGRTNSAFPKLYRRGV